MLHDLEYTRYRDKVADDKLFEALYYHLAPVTSLLPIRKLCKLMKGSHAPARDRI